MKNANTLAMPGEAEISNSAEAWAFQVGTNSKFKFPGLTKREMFAMHAMQGILSNSGGVIQGNNHTGTGWCNSNAQDLAKWSLDCADALLAELDK